MDFSVSSTVRNKCCLLTNQSMVLCYSSPNELKCTSTYDIVCIISTLYHIKAISYHIILYHIKAIWVSFLDTQSQLFNLIPLLFFTLKMTPRMPKHLIFILIWSSDSLSYTNILKQGNDLQSLEMASKGQRTTLYHCG